MNQSSSRQEIILTTGEDGQVVAHVQPLQIAEDEHIEDSNSSEMNMKIEGTVMLDEADISEVTDPEVFCHCANVSTEDKCPVHSSLYCLEDSELDGPNFDRALNSLPDGLCIRRSSVDHASVGVWSAMDFSARTRFGPFRGAKLDHIDNTHTSGVYWQVFKDGRTTHIIDSCDRSKSNWMRYINTARNDDEQNLKAYLNGEDVYYKTIKDVPEGSELLVLHDKGGNLEMGIRDFQLKPFSVNGTVMYRCPLCRRCFDTEVTLFKHSRNKHGGSSLSTYLSNKILGESGKKKTKPKNVKNDHIYNLSSSVDVNGKTVKVKTKKKVYRKGKNIKKESDTNTKPSNVVVELDGEENVIHLNDNQSNNAHLLDGNTEIDPETAKLLTELDKEFPAAVESNEMDAERASNLPQITAADVEEIDEETDDNEGDNEVADSEVAKNLTEPKNECEVCGKMFTHLHRLRNHMRKHTGEKPFECYICHKAFGTQAHLRSHMKSHGNNKAFKCEYCGKGFAQSHHMIRHQRIHTGEKPYKCDICGRGYGDSSEVKKHMRIHLGIKPYVCDECGMAFHQSQTLNRHKRTHTGEKPYRCDVCGKGFTRLINVKVHMRLHQGLKPYGCAECGKEFNQTSNLRTHNKVHTRERKIKSKAKRDLYQFTGAQQGGEEVIEEATKSFVEEGEVEYEVNMDELQKHLMSANNTAEMPDQEKIIIIQM